MSVASLALANDPALENTVPAEHQFEKLVSTYANDLYRYAYWLCHNRAVAEDLVQETLMRAWRSISKLREAGAIKAWLFTILRRENARQYERYRPEFQELDDSHAAPGTMKNTDTETWLLRHHIAELDENYRQPLVLQVIGGYSCDEIGNMLGISRGAVMTRIFRAKQKLRAVLEGVEGE